MKILSLRLYLIFKFVKHIIIFKTMNLFCHWKTRKIAGEIVSREEDPNIWHP